MTAAKEMSRPTSQHRLSLSSNAPAILSRNSYTRAHSQTASIGSVNPTNRINRRKSSTFCSTPKPAVIGAAVKNAAADASVAVNGRSSMTRSSLASLNDVADAPMRSSLPHHHHQSSLLDTTPLSSSSAVVDGPSLSSFHHAEQSFFQSRRASDETQLTKKEKGATGELKCEHCGKTYKHGSCLNKHLWEHTPQWQYTSKLLISKHQQVQLLEAASVLVAMNQDSHGANDSDLSSSSPAASNSSDMHDDEASSTETTPPPSEHAYRDSKRFSNNSSLYSRSLQSVFSLGSAPNPEHGFGHYCLGSTSSNSRPMTANTSIAESYHGDEDPQDLAAAVGLLSCSYGTPKSGPIVMPMDIPPVPPLPAQYRLPSDVDMDDEAQSEDEFHTRNDDVEYHGMFGKMDA